MVLHDPDIRLLLFDYLDEKYGKVRTLEEKIIGKSRSDVVAVIDDAIIGMEIKSDADSYERLPMQVKYYDKFFDYNFIVCGKSHSKQVDKHVPPYWGILTVGEDRLGFPCIELQRDPAPNPKIKIREQIKLIWKRELRNILAKNRMPKYEHKSRAFITSKILEKVPEKKLKRQMTDELFERDYTLLDD